MIGRLSHVRGFAYDLPSCVGISFLVTAVACVHWHAVVQCCCPAWCRARRLITGVSGEQMVQKPEFKASQALNKLYGNFEKTYKYKKLKEQLVHLQFEDCKEHTAKVLVRVRVDVPRCPHCNKAVLCLKVGPCRIRLHASMQA